MAEKLSITIHPSISDADNLTVPDAMRQVLDVIDLLAKVEAYQGGGSDQIVWRLNRASANSPFNVEVEATAKEPDISVALQAVRVKQMFRETISTLLEGGPKAEWLDGSASRVAKSLLQRNMNGVGRTDIDFFNSEDPLTIVHTSARKGVLSLDRANLENEMNEEDLTHTEFGSVEGEVLSTGLHHSKPALILRERLSGEKVVCVLSSEIAQKIGPEHSWLEVWTGRRTLITGAVYYDQVGSIRRINAENVETFVVPDVESEDIRDPNFTDGLSPSDFLIKSWEYSRG